jgi:hypothetical protein
MSSNLEGYEVPFDPLASGGADLGLERAKLAVAVVVSGRVDWVLKDAAERFLATYFRSLVEGKVLVRRGSGVEGPGEMREL